MRNKVLFVFEGKNPEKGIEKYFCGKYLDKDFVKVCIFGFNIYQLFLDIKGDNDLDIFKLIVGKAKDSSKFDGYSRNDFGEIYLFFDYDGHALNATDAIINEMLNVFNDETNNGKLFISYPMVEAIKHFSCKINFKKLVAEARENEKYKCRVNQETDRSFKYFKKYTKEITDFLVKQHLMKANYIVNDIFSLPSNIILQNEIFDKQLTKFINKSNNVSVLSSIPLFLLDYLGVENLSKQISES